MYTNMEFSELKEAVNYHWRELPQVAFLSRPKVIVATKIILVVAPANDTSTVLEPLFPLTLLFPLYNLASNY